MKGTLGMIAMLLALLFASAAVAWWAWVELGEVDIGLHGTIALAGGAIATLGVGVGLMWLVYYSARKGYDDEVGKD